MSEKSPCLSLESYLLDEDTNRELESSGWVHDQEVLNRCHHVQGNDSVMLGIDQKIFSEPPDIDGRYEKLMFLMDEKGAVLIIHLQVFQVKRRERKQEASWRV